MNKQHPITAASALFFFLLSPNLTADDRAKTLVKEIRTLYSSIEDGAKQLKTFSVQSDEFPDEGEMTTYAQNGKLAKIHISYVYGDHGMSDEFYYYSNGALIFAYKSDYSWKFSGKQKADGESETIDVITEYRVYFHNGEIISALKKQAESVNPENLKTLLGKADNKVFFDIALLSEIQKRGAKLSQISTTSEWKKYLLNGLE